MKTIFYIAIIISIASCKQATSPTESQEQASQVESNKTIALQVSGMHCTGCETTIENRIKEIEGVASIEADYQKGLATIGFDSTLTNKAVFVDAINSTGYKVEDKDVSEP